MGGQERAPQRGLIKAALRLPDLLLLTVAALVFGAKNTFYLGCC